MSLVIAYYVKGDNNEFSYVQLVNLETDELVQIKCVYDFYNYKCNIVLPRCYLRPENFTDFLELVIENYDSIDCLIRRKNIKNLVLAVYKNGVKILDLESLKVYKYHENSIFLSNIYSLEYDFESALNYRTYSKLYYKQDIRAAIEYNSKVVCRIDERLDLVNSRLETPWLEVYECGSGQIILDELQSMDGNDLIVFPKELKYLTGCVVRHFKSAVHCGALLFTENNKYIDPCIIDRCFKFTKVIAPRGCKGVAYFANKIIEYIY